MNFGPFKMAAKTLILACFTLFVVLPFLVACEWWIQDWRYTRFCWRGQQYYAQVADACNQLLNQNEPLPRQLKREGLQSLPAVLKELRPTYATVDTTSAVDGEERLLRYIERSRPAATDSNRSA